MGPAPGRSTFFMMIFGKNLGVSLDRNTKELAVHRGQSALVKELLQDRMGFHLMVSLLTGTLWVVLAVRVRENGFVGHQETLCLALIPVIWILQDG